MKVPKTPEEWRARLTELKEKAIEREKQLHKIITKSKENAGNSKIVFK